jgi:hypothetical protein
MCLRDVPPALRGAALMPAAAFAVHQLRYKLAFGASASHALAAQGHAYLASLTPWIVLLATLSVGATLGGLAQRWASGVARPGRAAGLGVWLAAALALLAIYGGQELLEGLLATGHPGGIAGVLGDGGWWAVPLALLIGGVLALALRGAETAERMLAAAPAGGSLRLSARALDALPLRPASQPLLVLPAPLARAAAGRAPPRVRIASLTP